VYDSRRQRQQVEAWVNAQEECPGRKQVKQQFPNVDQKHIRSAIQSRKDRERRDEA
jgi:hypothetical protein